MGPGWRGGGDHPVRNGLRVVALFEASKGVLVLLAGCGVLACVHRDLHAAAAELVTDLRLNPASRYPGIFLDAADRVTDVQLWAIALSALTYSLVRFVEAYGLWMELQWAEWFGLLSGAVYVPVELFELFRRVSWPTVSVLTVNLSIVAYLGYALLGTRRAKAQSPQDGL